jgi:outer membrane autotransporter protein
MGPTLFLMEGDTSIKLTAKYGYTSFDDEDNEDSTNIFDVNGDYYFNRQLSVGLGLSTYETRNAETVIKYKLSTNYYINDNISVYASYAFVDFDFDEEYAGDSDDVSTIIAGFNVRFY